MIDWIKKMRETERGRTLLKFILYMTFLAFVFVLYFVSRIPITPTERMDKDSSDLESTIPKEETKELTYYQKQEKLKIEEYEFTFTCQKGETITFYGKYRDGKIEGLKETKTDLIKYVVEEGNYYRQNGDQLEEYEDLYEGLNENVLDVQKLFQLLNENSAKIERRDEEKIYTYILENGTYKVITDREHITKIEVTNDLESYDLEFSY